MCMYEFISCRDPQVRPRTQDEMSAEASLYREAMKNI
ncbi:unnamed protein product [Haemonchus placei]|uniref:DUF1330 domain-containing protein n=1 Tax=Haemonchus placei TaxID=6290 RepID=A0A0N4VZE7_HAEPC|nr:unnamed protein product [Haemonchus placei]